MKDQVGNAIVDPQEFSVMERTGSDYGQINIHNNVIAMIAHETAKKMPGVVEMQGSWGDDLAGIIGKKSKDKGIRIEKENEEHLTIDLAVVLEYGVRIPDICVQLQAAVKEAVEDMTGKQVYAVNIVVQGIRNTREKSEGA
jgi:uncharacterized alkaline shock family protein YloU